MAEFRSASTLHGVEARLMRAVHPYGYKNAVVVRLGDWGPDGAIVIAYPPRAIEFYVQKRCAAQDPVLKHMLRSAGPFFWRDIAMSAHDNDECRDATDFMAVMRDFGVCDGVSIPLPPLTGQRAVLSLSAQRRNESPVDALGRLTLIAVAFWERWLVIAGREPRRHLRNVYDWPAPKLTRRQLDCLHYCQSGLSSQQIGEEMGVSENTVQFHVSNAMQELGANNRIHAVARAMELGLLDAG